MWTLILLKINMCLPCRMPGWKVLETEFVGCVILSLIFLRHSGAGSTEIAIPLRKKEVSYASKKSRA